jgi:hypothetical protein
MEAQTMTAPMVGTEQPVKTCPKCGETKPLSAFYRRGGSRPAGASAYCRLCHRTQSREWWAAHPEQRGANFSRYYHSDPARNAAHERRRKYQKHGITEGQYTEMVESQGGRCAICGGDNPGGRWRGEWHIDHDHVTGKVRGLLCTVCNQMLGYAHDSTDTLARAIAYLRNPPAAGLGLQKTGTEAA